MVKCIICNEQFKSGTLISFHKFPKDENRRTQWLDACKIRKKNLFSSSVICSKHFKKENFEYDKGDFTSRIRTLRKDAVPSIFNENKKLKRHSNKAIQYISIIKTTPLSADPVSSSSDVNWSTVDTNKNTSTTILIPSSTSTELASISKTIQRTSYTENVRYISELQEEHFASPRKRKRNVLFVKAKYEEMRLEKRRLQQKCRRLTERLSSLQDVLNRRTDEN